MHATERYSHILTELSRNASVSIKELTNDLGVSRETVRKDLEALSKEGKLNMVRGGAVRIRDFEPPLADRLQTNPHGKASIAEIVADLIPDGASILIDAGSTTFVAAELLAQKSKDLTVFTNDLRIALTMLETASEVHVIGGSLEPRDRAVYGLEAIEFVRRYRVDFALLGVAGVDAKSLFTEYSREASALREAMIMSSQQSFVLADASKFGRSGRAKISLTGRISLVTDSAPGKEIVKKLSAEGISVLLPEKK